MVVGGVLTQTDENTADHTLSVWDPTTGQRSNIGPVRDVIDTFTAANATSSLVAYTVGGCSTTGCKLAIGACREDRRGVSPHPLEHPASSAEARSPPDGEELAAFVDRLPETINPGATMVIIAVATATVERITGAAVSVGEPYGFATWSADGAWLYFGGLSDHLAAHYRGTSDAVELDLPAFYSTVAGSRPSSSASP